WELSKMEFDLLKLLVINSEMVLTRDKIIDRVWGWEISDNLLDSTIKNLRKKIDKDYEIKYLHTIRGVGYVIKKG
ncbi:MAG: winged helix-turn-helix transcriptional regulator, partial [Fusobacteriaceae bacterium]|nr:winged helix-turn-helix transcriptional regulator [Fusobacteriaceae bacterium]